MPWLTPLLVLAAVVAATEAPPINPMPRAALSISLLEWTFKVGTNGWTAEHDCMVAAADKVLKIHSTGNDPYLYILLNGFPAGPYRLELRARGHTGVNGGVYWATQASPGYAEARSRPFTLLDDGKWHDYSVRLATTEAVQRLRLDPGDAAGDLEIESIRLVREIPYPLVVERVECLSGKVGFTVKNDSPKPQSFQVDGEPHTLAAGATTTIDKAVRCNTPMESVTIDITLADSPALKWTPFVNGTLAGSPALKRTAFVYNPTAPCQWLTLPAEGESSTPPGQATAKAGTVVRVAPDGSMARIDRDGETVAILAPLVVCGEKVPAMKRIDATAGLKFEGEGVTLSLSQKGDELAVSIAGAQPCEGPAVRPLGTMKHGLLAGLEYLSENEHSSSTADLANEAHLRFAPDPLLMTMPLMAIATSKATVAVVWDDMELQPLFAVPNFFDGTPDSRMALRGRQMAVTIRTSGESLEENILWAVKRHGLPPLPKPPRTTEEQWKLCLAALNGPLKSEAGWGHCVESHWARRPMADHASTIWRLTGTAPQLPKLVPDGSHVRNESIYFVTGRAAEWLDVKRDQINRYLKQQQPDGSFRYEGPYRQGHFEDTASGHCARPAAMLLEYAWLTGDREAMAAGLKTLDYMERFCVPRGAQVWELSLHTPDILASAYLVWAYTRGYELTGKPQYLAQARRWAASGIPFVYLWGRYPVMLYGSIAVYGATNWQSPTWIGLPVQWCGGVYAYALTMLARHDQTLDWNHLARGILTAAEQMQFASGVNAGLLPDSWTLKTQHPNPWLINPCALVSLRLVLDGQLDSLTAAADGAHRIAAPFPVTLRDGRAHIQGRPGVKYQVLIDGKRIVDVTSRGEDIVPLN